MSSYDSAILKQYSALHRRWSKEQIVVPLFLTEEELRTSAAVFPLEFLEIQEQHRVLGGRDPFIGFHVKTDRLREAVVQGLTSHLLRLRQRYVEGGGSDEATTILLPLSITSTLPLLRGVQRLLGRPVLSHSDAVIKDVAEQLKLDLQGLLDAWLLKRGQISPALAKCLVSLTGICKPRRCSLAQSSNCRSRSSDDEDRQHGDGALPCLL